MLVASGLIANAQNDVNAKKVLDGVSAKLKTFKGVTAGFSYSTKDRKNVKKGSVSGQISIKGQQYYIKQGTTEIFCNGAKTGNNHEKYKYTVIFCFNVIDVVCCCCAK